MSWRNWVKPRTGALNTLLAPHYFASGRLVLTKRNDILAVFRLRGIDFECKTDEELESISKRLHTAFRNLNPGFRVYRYAIKTKGVNLVYHRAKDLYSVSFYLVLLYEGKPNTRSGLAISRAELDGRIEEIENHLGSFVSATGSLLDLERLGHEDIGSFLGKLTSSQPKIQYSDHIDYWAAQTPVIVTETGLYLDRQVRTLTLRQLPRTTKPNLFSSLLRLSCDLILCDEFKRIPNDRAIALAESFENHYFYKKDNRNARDAAEKARKSKDEKKDGIQDAVAIKNLSKVGEIKVRIDDGEFLGEYSLTLILAGDHLGRVAAKAINTVGNFEGELSLDGTGSLDAYLSVIPGNTNRNLRKQWILSMNYADLAPVYGPAVGNRINPQFGKEYQVLLETSLQTAYFFNHHQRYDESPDGICIGAKGSGKSVWANLQAHHLLSKYDPWVLILDGQGGSFRSLTEYHDGRYYDLAVDGQWPFTLNPFHLPDSSLTRQHLSMLIRTCCVVGGFVTDAEKNQIIYDEICRVMDLPKDRRRLSSLDLPKHIGLYLAPWVKGGQYSFVFDNEVDTFALKRLQTIDFSAINSYPDVLQPLLFHFFHLWDRVIDNDSLLAFPKQMIFDEAWKLLNFQPAREYMEKAGRTWRKRNGMQLFLSQSIVELKRIGMLDLVNELFQQKFLFANSTANYSMYASELDLNEKVVEQFKTLRGKGDFLFISPYGANKLHTNLTELERFLFAKSPNEDAHRTAAIAEHGFTGALQVLAKGA